MGFLERIQKVNNDKIYVASETKQTGEAFMNSAFGYGYATNSIKNNKSEKEKLYESLSKISDPKVREQVETSLMSGTPSEQFIDYLIKKYEKKQAEFEVAWAEYQASKNNLQFYKKIFETLEKKYENTESNYEAGLVRKADKNYTSAEMNTDLLLDKASNIAHRLV